MAFSVRIAGLPASDAKPLWSIETPWWREADLRDDPRFRDVSKDTGYSGHSLRAGLTTSASAAGVSSSKIREQTGHASDAMLGRYIRDGELFVENAAGALL